MFLYFVCGCAYVCLQVKTLEAQIKEASRLPSLRKEICPVTTLLKSKKYRPSSRGTYEKQDVRGKHKQSTPYARTKRSLFCNVELAVEDHHNQSPSLTLQTAVKQAQMLQEPVWCGGLGQFAFPPPTQRTDAIRSHLHRCEYTDVQRAFRVSTTTISA